MAAAWHESIWQIQSSTEVPCRANLIDTDPQIKGAPPIAADPGGFPDSRILGFFEKCGFWEFVRCDLGSGGA